MNSRHWSLLCAIVLMGSFDNPVKADPPSRTELLVDSEFGVRNVTFSKTGGLIAFACEDRDHKTKIRLFESKNHNPVGTIESPGEAIDSLQFSSDGKRLLTCSLHGNCIVWDVKTKAKVGSFSAPIGSFSGPNDRLAAAVMSHDGRYVVINDELGLCTLWDVASQKKIRHFAHCKLQCRNMVITSDDRSIMIPGPNGQIKWVELKSGRVLDTINPKLGEITCISLTPDDTKLLICGKSGTTKLWNVKENEVLFTWTSSIMPLVCVCRPDGRQVAIGTNGGYVILYALHEEGTVASMMLQSRNPVVCGLTYLDDGKSFMSCFPWDSAVDVWRNWPE